MSTNLVFDYIEAHVDDYIATLIELCRQPSVSAQRIGLPEMAGLMAHTMNAWGISAQVFPTPGAPVVYGVVRGSGDKTILFYNHYDVQPAEPLGEWVSLPFEPNIRDGCLYARGVADNKGDVLCRMAAVAALMTVKGNLPLTVKFIVDGEEEIDGAFFTPFVESHADLLSADVCLLESPGVRPDGQPTMSLGVKGCLYVELEAYGPEIDAHSGLAPVVPNPAWRLIWALSSLKGPDERVCIPGFYDHVRPWTPAELAALEAMPDEEATMRKHLGLDSFLGDVHGIAFKERLYASPTCTVCGFRAGYGGPGLKTILPAVARAKVDFRLVPDQTPDDILRKLCYHLDAQGFGDITVKVIADADLPARTDIDNPAVRAIADITRQYYGIDPIISVTGSGTCPMEVFIRIFGIPTLSAGRGPSYEGSQIHAPNENIRLADLAPSIKFNAYLLEALAHANF